MMSAACKAAGPASIKLAASATLAVCAVFLVSAPASAQPAVEITTEPQATTLAQDPMASAGGSYTLNFLANRDRLFDWSTRRVTVRVTAPQSNIMIIITSTPLVHHPSGDTLSVQGIYLDGLPMHNNRILANRLVITPPLSSSGFDEEYTVGFDYIFSTYEVRSGLYSGTGTIEVVARASGLLLATRIIPITSGDAFPPLATILIEGDLVLTGPSTQTGAVYAGEAGFELRSNTGATMTVTGPDRLVKTTSDTSVPFEFGLDGEIGTRTFSTNAGENYNAGHRVNGLATLGREGGTFTGELVLTVSVQ